VSQLISFYNIFPRFFPVRFDVLMLPWASLLQKCAMDKQTHRNDNNSTIVSKLGCLCWIITEVSISRCMQAPAEANSYKPVHTETDTIQYISYWTIIQQLWTTAVNFSSTACTRTQLWYRTQPRLEDSSQKPTIHWRQKYHSEYYEQQWAVS